MAASDVSQVCYNHPDKKADFKCFDCKLDSIINVCAQCNIQVHSLDVFRTHRVEQIVVKDRERRLSQDINDIEKLIAVESELLQNVLIRLKYCQQEERETLSHLLQLQTATKRRLAEIKECETRIDKAFSYLTKVSSMLTQCSSPVDSGDGNGNVKDSFVPAVSIPQTKSIDHVPAVSQQTWLHVPLAQESVSHAQNGPSEECPDKLPDEIKGKDMFPVSVVGSLTRNGSFWMKKIGKTDADKELQIQTGIRSYFHNHGHRGNVDVSVGAFCTSLNRFNKEFCRVRIESVASSGMVKIRFVDHGILEEVSRSSLCPIPEEFVDIPFQAMECCLFPNLDTQLPYEAKWCFKDLTFHKILMAALEGKVTDEKGHSVNHVILVSCGDVPVCINTKVASLVEEQRQAQEDRPLRPKPEDTKLDTPLSQTEPPSNVPVGADTKFKTLNIEYEEKTGLSSTDTDMYVADNAVPSTFDESVITQASNDSLPSLRAEAAEFFPSPPEDNTQSKIPFHSTFDQSSKVPGILHLPMLENNPVNEKPDIENTEALPDHPQILPGCVDLAEYNRIVSQCSVNTIAVETLPKARFVMIRSSIRRIIEGMKCDSWCWTLENNKRLNRLYMEQTRIGAPLFLFFSGPKSLNFCGMAQMVSPVDLNASCPTLTKPFWFANNMVGKCTIKWMYVHDLHFRDVITSNNHISGFSKWHLSDLGNGAEIPNRLGQLVIRVYDSGNKFRSILQVALESYQTSELEQPNNDPSMPRINHKPFELQDSFPLSQEEDWDLEIEESLKAAKSLKVEAVTASPDEKEAITVSTVELVSDESTPMEVIGNETSDVSDASAHFSEVSKDGVSITFVSVQEEELLNTVSSEEDVFSSQPSDSIEAVKDQGQSCAGSSFEPLRGGTSEYQKTQDDAISSCQAQSVQGSTTEALSGGDCVDIANTSDWESSSPVRAFGNEVVSSCSVERESSELQDNVNEIQKENRSLTDPEQNTLESSDPNSQNGSLNGHNSGSETGVNVPEDTGDKKLNDNEVPQGEMSDLGCAGDVSGDKFEPSQDFGDSMADGEAVICESTCSNVDDNISGLMRGEANLPHLDVDGNIPHSSDNLSDENRACQTGNTNGEHHGSSEDLLTDYEDLPVEIGTEHYVYTQENLSSSGTFWARVHRKKEEERTFVETMRRMGARIESKNELLEDIHIYKPCAVKGDDGYWYRAHIEKTPHKGKVGIRLLDLGEYWDVYQKELRVLDDEFYVAPPAQAFECSVSFKHPGNMKEKSKMSRVVKKNKKIKVLVKSYSEGTVWVEILS
ncbi:uncharacterized protein [Montipora capricornis]|uniref:uncharacterized protein isoform X2 n=1 Tax=Montipora capricornis TaxID=246305 RepID=UPI0035F18F1C